MIWMNGAPCVTAITRPDPTWYFPFIAIFTSFQLWLCMCRPPFLPRFFRNVASLVSSQSHIRSALFSFQGTSRNLSFYYIHRFRRPNIYPPFQKNFPSTIPLLTFLRFGNQNFKKIFLLLFTQVWRFEIVPNKSENFRTV